MSRARWREFISGDSSRSITTMRVPKSSGHHGPVLLSGWRHCYTWITGPDVVKPYLMGANFKYLPFVTINRQQCQYEQLPAHIHTYTHAHNNNYNLSGSDRYQI